MFLLFVVFLCFSLLFVSFFLIAAKLLIFFLQFWVQLTQGPAGADQIVLTFGLVPVKIPIVLAGGHVPYRLVQYIGSRSVSPLAAFLPFLTSMFQHGGWLHVIFNMWGLWIFGDNVEDYLGHFVY